MGPGTHTVQSSVRGAMEIESELCAPGTRVRLVHYHFPAPPHSRLRMDGKFRLDLCLTSRHRSARACYADLWNAQRFERIGAAFIVPPGQNVIACSDEDRSTSSLVCELDADPILRCYDRLPEPTDPLLLASLDVRDPNVLRLLLRLAEEVRHPDFASGILVEAVAAQMAIELFRRGATIVQRREQGGLAPWQLRRIDERLREVRETPTLAELAALCRISVRQLTRGFRVSRGCTIGRYVAGSQIEHAKQLLTAGETVSAIADALGFSSSSNFCFAFRRALGVTPGQFRQGLLRQ
jgi:AraC family transcriptional regulator